MADVVGRQDPVMDGGVLEIWPSEGPLSGAGSGNAGGCKCNVMERPDESCGRGSDQSQRLGPVATVAVRGHVSSSSHRDVVLSTVRAAETAAQHDSTEPLLPSSTPGTRHDEMSLFSSFIIEPVVRHARRFSGVVLPGEASDEGDQLACDNRDSLPNPPPHRQPESGASTASAREDDAAEAISAARPTALVQGFRRPSSLSQRPRSAVVDEEDSQDDLPIDTPVDMAANPSNTLADQLGRVQLDPSGATALPQPSPQPLPNTSTQASGSALGQNATTMSESLPADDGMAHLRKRIHEIRALDIPDQERARLVHGLMTEKYNLMRPTSPASLVSHDRPFTPASGESLFSDVHASSPYSSTSDANPDIPFNLREGDTIPTYRPQPHPHHNGDHGEEDEEDVFEGELVLGCQHYKRNVKVQCFECRRWYTCRHCHDAVEDHNLNRKMTQNMLCMVCGTPQKASDVCKSCETEAACYYCDICKLWDNNSKKKIYHCPDCGICRRGEGLGKDFYHCKVSSPCSCCTVTC